MSRMYSIISVFVTVNYTIQDYFYKKHNCTVEKLNKFMSPSHLKSQSEVFYCWSTGDYV